MPGEWFIFKYIFIFLLHNLQRGYLIFIFFTGMRFFWSDHLCLPPIISRQCPHQSANLNQTSLSSHPTTTAQTMRSLSTHDAHRHPPRPLRLPSLPPLPSSTPDHRRGKRRSNARKRREELGGRDSAHPTTPNALLTGFTVRAPFKSSLFIYLLPPRPTHTKLDRH